MTPQNKPTRNPIKTSKRVCRQRIIRAVPKIPVKRINHPNQKTGLKLNITPYDIKPPIISPPLATCTLIFHLQFGINYETIRLNLFQNGDTDHGYRIY